MKWKCSPLTNLDKSEKFDNSISSYINIVNKNSPNKSKDKFTSINSPTRSDYQ